MVVLMLITGEIYQLINFASFSRWFFIALATLGMLIHRYRFPLHPRPFKVSVSVVIGPNCTAFSIFTVLHLLFLITPGAPGHRSHLHSGLLLHRGSVSVFGPLEHGAELCSHTDRGPSLLCDRLPLPLAPQMETHLQ